MINAKQRMLSLCLIVNSHHKRWLLALTAQCLHVLLVELEVVDICVLGNASRVVALRQGHPVLLKTVPDQHLCRRLAMLVRKSRKIRVLGLLIPYKWAVRFDDDVVLVAVVHDFSLLQPRVKLLYVISQTLSSDI